MKPIRMYIIVFFDGEDTQVFPWIQDKKPKEIHLIEMLKDQGKWCDGCTVQVHGPWNLKVNVKATGVGLTRLQEE